MPISAPAYGVGGHPAIPTANPMGFARASTIPSQLLYYASDTASFDPAVWNTGIATGGGVAPAQVLGTITLGSGTANPGSSQLTTVPTFKPVNPGWLFFTTSLNIEFPVLTNAFRFWGLATVPGTPSVATPLTEACGFMIDSTGKLFAVTYQTGVRVNIADLSVATGNKTQPGDANAHNYIIYYRGDNIIWCIDSFDNVVAQTFTGAPGPNVNILPISYVCVANTTPPVSSATISINNTFLGDTTGSTDVVSDATYRFRGLTIGSDGAARMLALGANTVLVAAGTVANTVIKGTPGTYYGCFASTTGAGAGLIYDNATTNAGTPVGFAPTTINTFDTGIPANGVACVNGITLAGGATNPALTVFFR